MKLRCPAKKTETCKGTLKPSAENGGGVLDSARYRIQPGKSKSFVLYAGGDAEALAGSKVKLRLSEIDADGLPRKVVGNLPVKK